MLITQLPRYLADNVRIIIIQLTKQLQMKVAIHSCMVGKQYGFW